MSAKSAAAKVPGALSGLKRRGGGILVVGGTDGQRRLCGRLLGSSERERVVVEATDCSLTADCPHEAAVVQGRPAQPTACRAVADREGLAAAIEDHGIPLENVGPPISQMINAGWTPLVF